MDRIVNYIRLAWNLACMLRIYRTCNSMVGFSKYEFNNKLLGCVTLLRVTLSITWAQPSLSLSLYIYIYIKDKMTKYLLAKKMMKNYLKNLCVCMNQDVA